MAHKQSANFTCLQGGRYCAPIIGPGRRQCCPAVLRLDEPLWVKTGDALTDQNISAQPPKPDICTSTRPGRVEPRTPSCSGDSRLKNGVARLWRYP